METSNIIIDEISTKHTEKYIDNKRAIHCSLIQQLICRKETKKNYYKKCIDEYIQHLRKYQIEFVNSMPSSLREMSITEYFEKYKGDITFAITSLKLEQNLISNDKSPQDYFDFQETNIGFELVESEINHIESREGEQPDEEILINFDDIKKEVQNQKLEDLKIEKLNKSQTPLKERNFIDNHDLKSKNEPEIKLNQLQQIGTSKKRKRDNENGYQNHENKDMNIFSTHKNFKDTAPKEPILCKEKSLKKLVVTKLNSKMKAINTDKVVNIDKAINIDKVINIDKEINTDKDQEKDTFEDACNPSISNPISKLLSPSKRPWLP